MVEEDSREKAYSSLAGAGAGASTSGNAQISDPNQPRPSRAFESQGKPNSELVQQVFGLFKSYLTSHRMK